MNLKDHNWQISLGIVLLILSILVYTFHYLVFRDPHHIFIYLIGDIAFVFIEVLFVTLIIHSLLTMREKKTRLEKLNMIIGTFFSEVGTDLIDYFSNNDPNISNVKKELLINEDWSEKEFTSMTNRLKQYTCSVDITKIDLPKVRTFLSTKNDFLLRLLENPNLLEHESFTELLQAVFHLADELEHRKKLKHLSPNDYKHLARDIKRAYSQLVQGWLDYMRYLKKNYPYLFSLAMRLNPFDDHATVEVI